MKPALIGLLAWAAMVTVAEAQTVGTCTPATADAYLDVGNVRARLLNNGNLFWRGEPNVYNVPKGSSSNAVFISSFWIGGMVGGTLRMAATRYGPYEFWPGPLDEAGNPPSDCTEFDRIFVISKADVEAYEATSVAKPDLSAWPTGLGAPTLDASGNEIDLSGEPLAARKDRLIDLAAGERPAFVGDQMAWWVMNDAGNSHGTTDSLPIGIEVQALAFAFDEPGIVGNSTFYRFSIAKKGASPLTEAYIGLFTDPDLGDFADDWIGSDSTLGLGYVWNADDQDGRAAGYGTPPPALGYDFFQGPIVPSVGDVALVNGRQVPDARNLSMTAFRTDDGDGGVFGDPQRASDYYYYMQGLLKDGMPIYAFDRGVGRYLDEDGHPTTRFMFSGDAASCAFWTQCNADGMGTSIPPLDSRFGMGTGPFTIDAGSKQEVLWGIIFGRGEDNFDSVRELKAADEALQRFVDSWFTEFPEVPAAPAKSVLVGAPGNGVTGQPLRMHLEWECPGDALYCRMQWDDNPSFSSPAEIFNATSADLDLEPNTSYWWRIRGVGRGETLGPWSDPWFFTTGETRFGTVIQDFQVVANAAGALDPPECGAWGTATGFPLVACGRDRPDASRQQAGAPMAWVIHASGADRQFGPISDPKSFLGVIAGQRGELGALAASDWELRFTARGGKALRQDGTFMDVPFEAWRTGKGTPNDSSDDVRVLPGLNDVNVHGVFGVWDNHPIRGGSNDLMTDAMTLYLPDADGDGQDDIVPGEAGYEAWLTGSGSLGSVVLQDLVLVCLRCSKEWPNPQGPPETGTVFRIVTGSPQAPILAAPASGPAIRDSELRFFWTAVDGVPAWLEIATSAGFETLIAQIPNARPGTAVRLSEPGEYYWRVGSDFTGWSETWVANVTSLTGTDETGDLPTEYALDAIWPNPFNPLATIRFGLPADAVATVDVVDVLGRRVAVIDAGSRRAAGWHTVQFDGSRLASGVYFVRLVAGGRLDVESVVLLK